LKITYKQYKIKKYKMKLNFNDSIIIYPTEEGWQMILDDLLKNHSDNKVYAVLYLISFNHLFFLFIRSNNN